MVQLMKHLELVAVLVLAVALVLVAVMQVLVGCAGQPCGLKPGLAQRK
jgi:hypothetical protein